MDRNWWIGCRSLDESRLQKAVQETLMSVGQVLPQPNFHQESGVGEALKLSEVA